MSDSSRYRGIHGTAAEQRIAILERIPFFAHLNDNELVKVVGLTQLGRSGFRSALQLLGAHLVALLARQHLPT